MFAALYASAVAHDGIDTPWPVHAQVCQLPGYRGLILIRPDGQPHDLLCLIFASIATLRQAEGALGWAGQQGDIRQIAAGTVRYADVATIIAGKVAAHADVNGSHFDPENLPDLALRQRWAALWRRYDGHCGWINIDRGDGHQYNIAFFASAADAARLETYRTTQDDIRQFTATEIAPRSRGELVALGQGAVRWCDLRAVPPLT